MWLIRSVIILVGVVAFLWIGMKNADQTVDFSFFTKTYESLSLNLLMLIVFAAGMVFSFLIAAINEFQLRNTISSQRRGIRRLEEELAALRNLPLEEGESAQSESEIGL
ncbi:MAG: DUF1049 domain-containing protein [Candidatus Latescibacteria bacterium]|nr:DUF1049 domain-containing protein [Candidatus Latescibacterota bacterium]NIM21329.1 DUF1049 domain-containing protein [Candidatus Latescibacterota bacterium]NIM65510.1 DUF1049 domain-containing protein [Candidatus Latescibacterota bacterium]NIO01890.1 DUF1049 domain-containing protein [Candidatus Latescibacterota bacterium]NIO28703.1 DUF1049 domain-containing protein [Candidatus Latescibacterota bacterium]